MLSRFEHEKCFIGPGYAVKEASYRDQGSQNKGAYQAVR